MAAEVPLSLLDRLLDDAPDEAIEPYEPDEARFARFKLGLRRDLEGLLNSKRPHAGWLTGVAGIADTVVGFGLPDLSTEDFSAPATRERIRRMIAGAIRTYETRLDQVEVEVDGAPTSAGIGFRITAVVRLQAMREAVAYDARLRPNDRAIDVALVD